MPHMNDDDPCKILGQSIASDLIKKSDVLVLDEVAMMNRVDLERIERSLRLLMKNDKPFGGKFVILSGDFKQVLPVEKTPKASITSCIKNSPLYKKGIIKSKHLMINERVRRGHGDETYTRFLMYLGLGLLHKGVKPMKFLQQPDEVIEFPQKIGDVQICKDYENEDQFLDDLFPNLGTEEDVPDAVILTTKNVNMNDLNEKCLTRFKPDDPTHLFEADNWPWHPDMKKKYVVSNRFRS